MNNSIKDTVIYGAGGLGKEVLSLIRRDFVDRLRVVGFIDDAPNMPSEVAGIKLLSKEVLAKHNLAVVLGFANPKLKSNVLKELSAKTNLSFPKIVSKKAVVGSNVLIGIGTIITDFCWLSTDVVINDAVFINIGSAIGHDVTIGDCCSIMPQCAISGCVKIGKETLIGAKSFILQGATIGDNATIIAGSVICRSVGNNGVALGNPARVLKGNTTQ